MKLKLLLRHLSISAPRMTIRTHRPWPVRVVAIFLLVGGGAALGIGSLQLWNNLSPSHSNIDQATFFKIEAENKQLKADSLRLQAEMAAADSKIAIEIAAKTELAQQLRHLENEIGNLKSDLAFFEQLMPLSVNAQGPAIRGADFKKEANNKLSFRLLLVQNSQAMTEFEGQIHFILKTLDNQKNSVNISYPNPTSANTAWPASWPVKFKQYQKLEGSVTIPAGSIPQSVTVRLMRDHKIQAERKVLL